jgi:pimeloyl-ACP methyl ester carboxylesterase
MIWKYSGVLLLGFALAMTSVTAYSAESMITTVTADDVTIYGDAWVDELDTAAPLVLLFHQAGSNGRGEYSDLAPWLSEAGFRVISWDQRSGGERFGASNRTVTGLTEGTPVSYCDAYPDLQAALDYTMEQGLADKVIVWGSSYSASLVFRLAAENPDKVSGVVSCSPAAGGPMVDCRARMWVDDVVAPVLVLRPDSEMTHAPSVEQRDILMDAGVRFHVVENGKHGSSMLVDSRTGHDMSGARATVIDWLIETTGESGNDLRPPDDEK